MDRSTYDAELASLGLSYADAASRNIDRLKSAIAAAGMSSIVGVGSGGSFTVASLLCGLHEAYAGRVSRASTPLELICNPNLASASPVFLLSAEGKNPDIIESLRRARNHSSRPIHVITNRTNSPLTDAALSLSDVRLHTFELQSKDGYLATNSLLFDAVIIARAYGDFDPAAQPLPKSIAELAGPCGSLEAQISELGAFADIVANRGAVIVLYAPQLRAVAIDLESKLAEAALVHCQLADLRSFAHGRHLWLAERPQDCAILALTEPSLQDLWEATKTLLPNSVPLLNITLNGARPSDLICGLVMQMHLVAQIARAQGRDPANPEISEFGRSIHYIDLPKLVPPPRSTFDNREVSKFSILGANWSTYPRGGAMRRALGAYESLIAKQTFKAIVFDYDGTLCSSQASDVPPPNIIVEELVKLLDQGVRIGIASGRGGSIQEHLAAAIPERASNVTLGLYNGGWIGTAADFPETGKEQNEFISHATRISRRLKDIGVPIVNIRTTQPFQVSLRLAEGVDSEQIWFVIADALRLEGLDLLRVLRSKHSVDILSPQVNKSRIVRHLIQEYSIDPYQILTFGDQGAWPGNDASLLEHRYSLSVDQPSRLLDRGWNLAPSNKRELDAMLWYLSRIDFVGDGTFRLKF
jgi:HAD superfamily hydrolase (TIGR01484 family)